MADPAQGSASESESARAHLRETDLAPLVERYDAVALTPDDDLFERLVVSIVRQLISTAAAQAIVERLRERFDLTPEAMLAADEAALREVGLSASKVEYVRTVARWWRERDPDRAAFEAMDDAAVVDALTDVRGVGEWTAEMALMLGLARPDVFPVGDLAVRRGMELRYGDLTRAEMVERAEPWRPYRSYATLYLWTYYVDEALGMDPDDLVV